MKTSAIELSPKPLAWYREITAAQWRILIGAWGVWALDAIDFLTITFVLSDIAKSFGVGLETTSLLLFATYGVRWIGGLLFGGVSDRIGRKVPLLITLTWFTLGAAFTGLAWSFTAIVVFRLILGFGMAPGFSLGATMVAESWPEKHRALGIGILDTGWGIGAIGAAAIYGLVYPYAGWRGMFFVGIIPALLLGLFILFFVPESPMWQTDRARRVAQGSRHNPVVTLFRKFPGRVGFLTILMVVLCFGSWPFQGLFPTYLKSLNFSTSTITWLTTTSAIGQIFGFFCSGLIAERLGRRAGLGLMLALGTVGVLVLVAVIDNIFLAELAAFFCGFMLVGSSGIWGTILTENLPSEVRASGVGFLYNVGVIGGGIAPFVVLSSLHRLDIDLRAGIGIFTVIASMLAGVLLWFVRETKGLSLRGEDAGQTHGELSPPTQRKITDDRMVQPR
jgi:SHS family sialic acid transporter-like MFS transporter